MKKKKLIKKGVVLGCVVGAFLCIPSLIFAADATATFKPLQPLPGYTDSNNLAQYLKVLFRIGITIAALLAVFKIVIGGFKYMTSEAPGGKGDGKSDITDAIIGLLIVLLTVIILQLINPNLLNLNVIKPLGPAEYNVFDPSVDLYQKYFFTDSDNRKVILDTKSLCENRLAGTPAYRLGDNKGCLPVPNDIYTSPM